MKHNMLNFKGYYEVAKIGHGHVGYFQVGGDPETGFTFSPAGTVPDDSFLNCYGDSGHAEKMERFHNRTWYDCWNAPTPSGERSGRHVCYGKPRRS